MFEIILSAIAAFLLLFLSVYTLFKQRTSFNIALSSAILLLAAIEILDQFSMHSSYDPILLKKVVILAESLLPLSFVFFSITYARQKSVKSVSFLWRAFTVVALFFPASVLVLPINNFFFSPDLQTERMLFLETTGYWFYMGLMIYCIVSLVNLEATFSSTSGSGRWRMKFEFIGVSSIIAVLIFYFSQGLLYKTINMNLAPIRSSILIIAAILIAYSKLFRGNGVKVVVSRYIFYRSLTLLLVGLYFIILGIIGEGMRYFGISFSRDLTIFIAFASGIMMLLVLLSEKLRREVKVFVSKHFFAHKHDYRIEWLKFTGRLSSCRSFIDVKEAILTAYRETFGLKGASLYLIDSGKGSYTLAANQSMPDENAGLPAATGLITYFIERERVFNPVDGEYTLTAEEAFFVRQTGARLIVPLTGNNGEVEGFVIFGGQQVQEEFIYEDYDLMKTIAKQAALSIINFRLSEELAETRELTAVGKISSFIIHDLKNLTSTLSLTIANAEEHMSNPEFQRDMVMSIKSTLNKMKVLIQKLKSIPKKHLLQKKLVDMDVLAREMAGEVMKLRQGVEIFYQGSPALSLVDAEEMRKVILNLMLNAVDVLGQEGIIRVETGANGDTIFIKVTDNGCGMTKEFINNHLFKPFKTTKKKGLGIGLYQCRQIIEAHEGKIWAESEIGKGTVFTVCLPIAEAVECVAQ